MEYVWKTIMIFVIGTILLRIAGRKSISQTTIPETILMIAIGTLLIQPVSGHGFWTTMGLAGILVLCLIAVEFLQVKSAKSEAVISGQAIPVIVNGSIQVKNLKKMRLSVDKLEARLRQAGIASHEDIEYATIEASGQLGYTVKQHKQPATKEDIQQLISLLQSGQLPARQADTAPLFTETLHKNTKGADYLQ